MSTIPLDLDTDTVVLPPPAFVPGARLAAALQRRRSERDYSDAPVPNGMLSALLWAGCGINRRDSGHCTAPSAHNWQEIMVFVVVAEGACRYGPAGQRLLLVDAAALRPLTGLQAFVAGAPLNMVYVADDARTHGWRPDEQAFFDGADAGMVAQNVSLYCASAGLATVVRALAASRRLAPALQLSPAQR